MNSIMSAKQQGTNAFANCTKISTLSPKIGHFPCINSWLAWSDPNRRPKAGKGIQMLMNKGLIRPQLLAPKIS